MRSHDVFKVDYLKPTQVVARVNTANSLTTDRNKCISDQMVTGGSGIDINNRRHYQRVGQRFADQHIEVYLCANEM